jgi:hypothetical protein
MVIHSELHDLGLPDVSDRLWPAIGNLFLRRWFVRRWIVQEVVLAQEIDVFCGRRSVAWEQLVNLGLSIRDAGLGNLCNANNLPTNHELIGFGGIEVLRNKKPLDDTVAISVDQ